MPPPPPAPSACPNTNLFGLLFDEVKEIRKKTDKIPALVVTVANIEKETGLTNGRVSKLEEWVALAKGFTKGVKASGKVASYFLKTAWLAAAGIFGATVTYFSTLIF